MKFLATNFLTKNAPKFSPNILNLYLVGLKTSLKIPAKFPNEFPCDNYKNCTNERLQERREKKPAEEPSAYRRKEGANRRRYIQIQGP